MILREINDGMRTDNEILGPNTNDDPALHMLGSLPGPESPRRDLLSTCHGVKEWFGKSTTPNQLPERWTCLVTRNAAMHP